MMGVIEQYIQHAGEAMLRHYQPREPRLLYDPIDYVIGLGGKRLRPALCMSACHFFSGDGKAAEAAAMGLEMFHNFTLLHDDIMDHATMRRNQPTVHLKWNENAAILSGDAMMILASQMMLDVPDTVLKTVQTIYLQTALEVCEGQQYDMDFETRDDVTVDEYLSMIRLKTAVLIAASLKIGAMIGGASSRDADLIYQFGINIGLAFQLQDDYLDVYGDPETFGKRIGGDIVSNKKTFLLLACQKLANSEQKEKLNYWLHVADFDRQEKIDAVVALYDQLGIAVLSKEKMETYYMEALRIIEMLGIELQYKDALKLFASHTLFRTK